MPRPPKTEERSEEIMRAFEICVARKGVAQTTLADVADEARLPRSLVRYFMGNRDEMVDRLVERLMARGEASLARIRDASGDMRLDDLIRTLFEEVFANELSNTVAGELWTLAKTDDHIAGRLSDVYAYAVGLVEAAIRRDRPDARAEPARSAAIAVLSLILGQLTLADFGVSDPDPTALRKAAVHLVQVMVGEETKV